MVWFAVAAAVVSAVSAIQQGNAKAASDKSAAAAANYNQTIDQQNATMENQSGTQKELTTREQTAQSLGEARARIGQAGIGGPGGGTQSIALDQDSVNGELNALSVRYQRDTGAANYMNQGGLQGFEQGVDLQNATTDRTSGQLGALSAVFKGGSSIYGGQTPGSSGGGSF